jgi:hypothetical protein
VYTAASVNEARSAQDRWVSQLMPGLQSTGIPSLTIYKSAVAGHRINLGYCNQLQDTSILPAKSRYTGFLIKANEIAIHPNNM